MTGIKYNYARDFQENIISISKINENNRKELFYCISCKNILIPKLGKKNKHHFAHKQKITCNKETYLHILAKNTFHEIYNKCLENNEPFFFEHLQEINCIHAKNECYDFDDKKTDLTEYYKTADLETKYNNNFTPDILLKSKLGKPLFIEIAVTHPCSDDKKESKIPIIEITIQKESDIEGIKQKLFSEEEEKEDWEYGEPEELNGMPVKTYNLLPAIRNKCLGQCPEKIKEQEIKDQQEFVKQQRLRGEAEERRREEFKRLKQKNEQNRRKNALIRTLDLIILQGGWRSIIRHHRPIILKRSNLPIGILTIRFPTDLYIEDLSLEVQIHRNRLIIDYIRGKGFSPKIKNWFFIPLKSNTSPQKPIFNTWRTQEIAMKEIDKLIKWEKWEVFQTELTVEFICKYGNF